DLDFENNDIEDPDCWRHQLTWDRLTRRVIYEGPQGDELIDYALDGYLLNDAQDENNPNRISLYDYDGGATLSEVRSYYLDELALAELADLEREWADLTDEARGWEEWFEEDLEQLESIMVYEGSKGKERISYTLFNYFPEYYEDEDLYVYWAWERVDYHYDVDILEMTRAYDITELGAVESSQRGEGILMSETHYHGDSHHERIDYSFALYDGGETPGLRTDYEYNGRALISTELYNLTGLELPEDNEREREEMLLSNKDVLQETSEYTGRAGRERSVGSTTYYPEGEVLKDTSFTYGRNERGVYWINHITQEIFSEEGERVKRTETENDISYEFDGEILEDLNGNTRSQNTKVYYTYDGAEHLEEETDSVFYDYMWKGKAGNIERTNYIYENGVKIETSYQSVTNHMFDAKGSAIRQTIESYVTDIDGERVYRNTQEIENRRFDYYGNTLNQRITTIYTLEDGTAASASDVIENTYTGIDAIMGNVETSRIFTTDVAGDTKERFIEYSNYDLYGNSWDLTITEINTEDGVEYTSSEVVHNTYEGIGAVRGNASTSRITSTDVVGNEKVIDITYSNYDPFGNSWNQVVVTSWEDEDGTVYTARDTISNTYDSFYLTSSNIVTVDAAGESKVVNITYSNHDIFGNALDQVIVTSLAMSRLLF
ncbi:hypothetical protein ACFL3J_03255, partial [Candidatus Omnitrophota bacterium]